MQWVVDEAIMNWGTLIGFAAAIYFIFLLCVIVDIVNDSESVNKTIGYLLLILFVPLFGVILYYSIGVNYRNRQMYSKKIEMNETFIKEAENYFKHQTENVLNSGNIVVDEFKSLASLVGHDYSQSISNGNSIEVLSNGENAFPKIIEALESAKSTIHLEYYIVRNDHIAHQIKDILIRKVKEGVKVRFIYDDFGSRPIHGEYVKELRDAGVEIYPFLKLIFVKFANRINYRNHRKIIVIDGHTGFVGGMNIGDEYINTDTSKDFYRDVHLKVKGPICYSLQNIFICDWKFCSKQTIHPDDSLLPWDIDQDENMVSQIVASGPDSKYPMIMYSLLRAITLSKSEIMITTPYFVPSEPIMEALINASLSGIDVKIIVPYKTNSIITQLASCSYYLALMEAGVEIYRYKRGFIHAKTSVFDQKLSMIGTANMDNRSFNLNFEVNAIIYDENIGQRMKSEFMNDLGFCEKIELSDWKSRNRIKVFIEKLARLSSSLL